ncbi:hypothetical protein GMJAKD_14890 [Candidatus Electrothrix aarhusensis]
MVAAVLLRSRRRCEEFQERVNTEKAQRGGVGRAGQGAVAERGKAGESGRQPTSRTTRPSPQGPSKPGEHRFWDAYGPFLLAERH